MDRAAGEFPGVFAPLLLLFLITTSGIPAHAADDSATCRAPFARIVSIQGTIELLRARQNDWSKVSRLDTPLCEGDRLRTGALSRAALSIQPETLVRVDQNTSISVSQTAEETLVEFTQEEVQPAAAGAYSCGAGYFITRFPRKFRVNTPHLNAGVEGTEFLVAMRCESTELSVFEGKVLAAGAGANIFPVQSISRGQILTIGGSEPPAVKLLVKPADAVQWVLYYPPLTDPATAPVEDCRLVALDSRAACYVGRAEQLLRAGRVDEAQASINDALAAAPYNGDAQAVLSVISLVKNDKAEAMRLAREAVEATPNAPRAWLALSYAQQGEFKLDEALKSSQRAAELAQSSAVIQSRIAELLMSSGRIREAEAAATRATEFSPQDARAHMVLGFVHLAKIDTKLAKEEFQTAITLDSSEPLSRLGFGLAEIREGKLTVGREQLEIAAALDPQNSLLRSYLGKAYFEENTKERDQIAASQFSLAKDLDPKDPTSWFYDAILKQSKNQAVASVEDLEKSMSLNDNRAVYRSQLLLDEDRAARTISLAQAYRQLGFDQQALTEASRSIGYDPSSSSAHRFLADVYSDIPRYDIARQSELLQSQLRQPISLTPLQPDLTTGDRFALGILRDTGPTGAGLYEFNPLFSSNGLRLQASAVTGGNGTFGDQLAVSGVADRFAFSVSQLYYDTEGFRANDDFTKEAYNGFVQLDLSTSSSVQVEARQFSSRQGDTVLRFDPNLFFPDRGTIDGSYLRFGGRQSLGPQSDLLVSLIDVDARNETDVPGLITITQDFHTKTAELQYSGRGTQANVIGGLGYYSERKDISTSLGFAATDTVYAYNVYLYSSIYGLFPNLQLQLGVSADHISPDLGITGEQQDEINPKLGVVLDITPQTTLRAAALRVLKRRLFTSQTLEPTQVAGFNQFFDDFDGSVSRLYGIGLDLKPSSRAFTGIEASYRSLDIPQAGDYYYWQEKLGKVYAYWAPISAVALAARYEIEKLTRDPLLPGPELFLQADTYTAPISVTGFFPGGVSAQLVTTFVKQTGVFFMAPLGPDATPGSDQFWICDVGLSYLLPQRLGLISLEVRNLFDRSFQFQETDLVNTRFARDRLVLLRGVISF